MLEQSEKLRELRELKEKARQGGDPRKAQEIHEKGRMTARERIQHLLDPGLLLSWIPLFSINARISEWNQQEPLVTDY